MRQPFLSALLVASSLLHAGEYIMPKLPDGLEAKVLIASPNISEVVSVSASADGRKVYVGMQHSACENGKWGDIKMLYDADGDGTYERVTMFATETGGGQGMLCIDDTLYLVHSPYLTSYRDLDGDGVAEEKKNLLEGLGPAFTGGLHDHTVSGVNAGTDGWLYISVGDKGVLSAKGADGRKVQLNGGGILRVRPDGTDAEIYCVGLRNTMDVGIDPELNVFMRDNTNDGGGWNVRSTHIWQGGQYGYPNLYKNYVEEMLPCMDDHGGGSPCGCVFYNEIGLRAEDRGKLLFCDWGRAIVYRYDLDRKGATYVMKQTDWIKNQNPFRAVDIQPDAVGHVYIADWGRGGWGKGAQAGAILKIAAKGFKADLNLPKFKELDTDGLVHVLKGQSQTLRLMAQKELLARGEKAAPALLKIMEGGDDVPRMQRVFALWTYKQIAKDKATDALLRLAETRQDFREHALRAATDRKKEVADVSHEPFKKALKDEDPFVRGQAAVSLGRLGTPPETSTFGSENFCGPQPLAYGVAVKNKKEIAEALCEALGDAEVQVRHVAMRGLRAMGAHDECLKTAETGSEIAAHFAFMALREMYTDAAADGLISLCARLKTPERKMEALKAIGRLAKKEEEWKGQWWGTQPNTIGPFQRFVTWSSTEKLIGAIKTALVEKDEQVVLGALWALKCMRDETSVAEITKLMEQGTPKVKSEALQALLATRPPQAVPLFAKMLADSTVLEGERKAALDALAKIKNPAADVAIVDTVPKLEAEFKGQKFDKNNGILPLARKAMAAVKSVEPVNGLKAIVQSPASEPESRTAAAQALSSIPGANAAEALASLLNDPNADLVALALRNINPKGTLKPAKIREFTTHADLKVQGAALIALGKMKDFDSAELIATKLKTISLQAPATEALKTMGPGGNEGLVADVIERILAAVEAEEIEDSKIEMQAVAVARLWVVSNYLNAETSKKLQVRLGSQGGVIATWNLMGPVFDGQDKSFEIVYDIEKVPPAELAKATMKVKEQTLSWKPFTSTDPNGVISFNEVWSADGSGAAFAYCDVEAPKEMKAKLVFGSDDSLTVYVNGERVWNKDYNRGLNPEEDKIDVKLKAGKNVIMVKVCNHAGGWQLCGRIEGLAKRGGKRTQQRESMIAEAMSKTGNVAKGEALFNDEKRAGCIRCHQVNHKGGNVGPDLSSIGATKDRKYLIDAVLEPSKEMAQGFQPMKITYTSGKVAFGVILNESVEGFELATAEAKRESIKNADVKSKVPVTQSVMPEGLADSYTREEFLDLITYVSSLKK